MKEESKLKIKGDWQTRRIWIDGEELFPGESQKIINHSPDGFAWGYGGSGPAQLALAILLKFLPKEDASARYQQFKWDVIAGFPQRDFEANLTEIKRIKQESGARFSLHF